MVYNEWGFDTSILKSLNAIKQRIELNKAAMIIVDGGVGEGKTTLATKIAEWYEPGWFNHIQNLLAIGGSDFTKKLEYAYTKGHRVVVYDEAGDFASRGALTNFNKNLNRVFETYRSTQILVILCLPDFDDLDKSLMKKRVARLLVHTHGRSKSYGRFKFYSLWRMWYLKDKMKNLQVPPQAYQMQIPNGRGLFKDHPKDKREILAKISNKGKSDIRKISYLNNEGLLSTGEAARKIGVGIQTFTNIKRLHGLEAAHSVGRSLYYKEKDVDAIIRQRESKN